MLSTRSTQRTTRELGVFMHGEACDGDEPIDWSRPVLMTAPHASGCLFMVKLIERFP